MLTLFDVFLVFALYWARKWGPGLGWTGPEVSQQTMSVPVPLIGKATKIASEIQWFLRKFNVNAFKDARVMYSVMAEASNTSYRRSPQDLSIPWQWRNHRSSVWAFRRFHKGSCWIMAEIHPLRTLKCLYALLVSELINEHKKAKKKKLRGKRRIFVLWNFQHLHLLIGNAFASSQYKLNTLQCHLQIIYSDILQIQMIK